MNYSGGGGIIVFDRCCFVDFIRMHQDQRTIIKLRQGKRIIKHPCLQYS